MNQQQQFLADIENDIDLIIDGYYAAHVDPIINKIRAYLNAQHWNSASHLPTPNIQLKVTLADGSVHDAVRPGYISSRDAEDLGYRDADGNILTDVVKWTIA